MKTYQRTVERLTEEIRRRILRELKKGPCKQPELRQRLGVREDDELSADQCWAECEHLKAQGKLKETKSGVWSLVS